MLGEESINPGYQGLPGSGIKAKSFQAIAPGNLCRLLQTLAFWVVLETELANYP
jgi:hypothetical protein